MSTTSAVLSRGRNAPPAPRDVPQHVSPGLWTLAWRRLKADRVGMVSLAIVGAFLVMMVLSATGLVAKDWSREVGVSDRTPIRTAEDGRENLFRARLLLIGRLRPRDENAAPARRLAGFRRLEGPGDGHLVDRRRRTGMPVHVEMRVVRLAQGFQQRLEHRLRSARRAHQWRSLHRHRLRPRRRKRRHV